MENGHFWYVVDINPEPWKVGPVSVGRKGTKLFGNVGPDRQLQGYQQAVRELLEDDAQLLTGDVEIQFFFWRNMEPYLTHQARTHRKHQADATNMQKALEDAIQGLLIENDRNVRRITSTIVNQDHNIRPCVAICVKPFEQTDVTEIPLYVWEKIYDIRDPERPKQLMIE